MYQPYQYQFLPSVNRKVLVVGCGPAGLFCSYVLAKSGVDVTLVERGKKVEERVKDIHDFMYERKLNTESNILFGEGGAGTFSDGKLNTGIKDKQNRIRFVLETFVKFGADERILYDAKPHIGTDILKEIVFNMRKYIVEMGGTFYFNTSLADISYSNNKLCKIHLSNHQVIETDICILAIGHSARDTFSFLYQKGVPMAQKAFAVGLRIQHPQKMINQVQYGEKASQLLGPAPYKVTWKSKAGRGVYSFCMCPGGYVVNASSEPERLAVNGMSNHDRAGKNANSALIVTVTPEDFGESSPLAGVEFQRRLEEAAYFHGEGKIPIQLYGDFKENISSKILGDVEPQIKGAYQFANLRQVLPNVLCEPLIEGMEQFEHKIQGFSRYDSILAGVESRTSSPVRIHRDESFQSEVKGLYPCGEGAGYAGGIVSAAMDGIRVAEEIGRTYRPQ